MSLAPVDAKHCPLPCFSLVTTTGIAHGPGNFTVCYSSDLNMSSIGKVCFFGFFLTLIIVLFWWLIFQNHFGSYALFFSCFLLSFLCLHSRSTVLLSASCAISSFASNSPSVHINHRAGMKRPAVDTERPGWADTVAANMFIMQVRSVHPASCLVGGQPWNSPALLPVRSHDAASARPSSEGFPSLVLPLSRLRNLPGCLMAKSGQKKGFHLFPGGFWRLP